MTERRRLGLKGAGAAAHCHAAVAARLGRPDQAEAHWQRDLALVVPGDHWASA